jgi:hypothetical protein
VAERAIIKIAARLEFLVFNDSLRLFQDCAKALFSLNDRNCETTPGALSSRLFPNGVLLGE